jgi:putative transposase
MPRRPRQHIPDIPCHVTQRGINRSPCFFEPGDRATYLERLAQGLKRHAVALHAYVLMTNHVHLLLTASSPTGISKVMQSVGRRYVQHINWKYSRTGGLWEGRYKSSVVAEEDYLLRCYLYIEMNPVRAGIVADPADYPWSSFRCNAKGEWNPLVTPHASYLQLGIDAASRQQAYAELQQQPLSSTELQVIRRAARQSAPIAGA